MCPNRVWRTFESCGYTSSSQTAWRLSRPQQHGGCSRGLPKPNYFPLLPPISPGDARRFCRITGKSYGLPSHHYIPVLLTANSANKVKCKITNVSGELGPHHYTPEINYGNRKHNILPDYRYVFPVLDGSNEAQKNLLNIIEGKSVNDDKKYVYIVQERRCSLVFPAGLEAAVRDGDIRDVMLAKDSDSILIKMKQGRNVSMDFTDFVENCELFEGEGPNENTIKETELEEMDKRKKRKRTSGLASMKKIFEDKDKLAEIAEIEEEKIKEERQIKRFKEEIVEIEHLPQEKDKVNDENLQVAAEIIKRKSPSADEKPSQIKSGLYVSNGDWKNLMRPLIESWDWDTFEREAAAAMGIPKITSLPQPIKATPLQLPAELTNVPKEILNITTGFEKVPAVEPFSPVTETPDIELFSLIKNIPVERLENTAQVNERLSLIESSIEEKLPLLDDIPQVVKNIANGKRSKINKVTGLTLDINAAKKFVPGQIVETGTGEKFVPGQTVPTPSGPVFVPGFTVETQNGPLLVPGHTFMSQKTNEPFFVAGQTVETSDGEKFMHGQSVRLEDGTIKFIEGQTIFSDNGPKFVPGKVSNQDSKKIFVPGQTILTSEGPQFVPGQIMRIDENEVFVPGQNVCLDSEWQFVPGQNIKLKDDIKFIPGTTLHTDKGPKFVAGQTVMLKDGSPVFVPGITVENDGNVNFIPGTTIDTLDGPKFIEGQIVETPHGDKFMPGKTIVGPNGEIEFAFARSVKDIVFIEQEHTGFILNSFSMNDCADSVCIFGHMVQNERGIEFFPGVECPDVEGKVVSGRLMKGEEDGARFIPGMMIDGAFVPGQIVFTEHGEKFVPGQVIETGDGAKFVPGQIVETKTGNKFVPGQTIETEDGPRFIPGQIVETKVGPTFIPGQVIHTDDEGSRFVPGQVVDTDEGPRFVPGRVVESGDRGVTFIPGQVVKTEEGLKFVAPDLTEGEGGLEFSVQSFVVTPEELRLLKVHGADATSRGELSIDARMLRQLSEAGMSVGRQVPAEIPVIDIVLEHSRRDKYLDEYLSTENFEDEIKTQLKKVLTSIIDMSIELHDKRNQGTGNEAHSFLQNGFEFHNGHSNEDKDKSFESIKSSIAAAALAASVMLEQYDQEINNNHNVDKYKVMLDTLGAVLSNHLNDSFINSAYKILQSEDEKKHLYEQIDKHVSQNKVDILKLAINKTAPNSEIDDSVVIDKLSFVLRDEKSCLGPAFKNISKSNSQLVKSVLENISRSAGSLATGQQATETLQKAIISAVRHSSELKLDELISEGNDDTLKELLLQSIGLAKTLGMCSVAKSLSDLLLDPPGMLKLASDETALNILRRLTVIRELAENQPNLRSALKKLEINPELARSDPKLRELVRESAALMIVPDEPPLQSSADVPLTLFNNENSLAMEDFLFQRKKHPGTVLIMKRGLQAVVPRESSRAVLTGQVAYTLIDEKGVSHFEPLHVFSALRLNQPTAHRFSMYCCPVADGDEVESQCLTECSSVSEDIRMTKLGCWIKSQKEISSRGGHPASSEDEEFGPLDLKSETIYPSVDDVIVASCDYTAAEDDEVSLKAGDIVEILQTTEQNGSKISIADSIFDLGESVTSSLLDTSAARHKLSVRPKRTHIDPRQTKTTSSIITTTSTFSTTSSKTIQSNQVNITTSSTVHCTTERPGWTLVRVVEIDGAGKQGWVPSEVLKAKDDDERLTKKRGSMEDAAFRRQAVVRELVETEEEFGRDLQQVVERYMKPVDSKTTPKVVSDNKDLVFNNFKQIAEFHNTVLIEGVKYYANEPRMLGKTFLRMEREFDKHVAYCRDEPSAQIFLQDKEAVREYFDDLSHRLGDDKTISEHLKLPIQRINDYQLLLKELVKYSTRLGEDCTDLQKALELMLGVPHRATDNKFISSIEGYNGNIYKLGRLLTHDWFTVTDGEGQSKERYLFLFKARILICKVKRISDDRSVFILKDIIKVPEVEVKDHPADLFKFELHSQLGPLYPLTLTAHKELVKQAWLKEIRQYSNDVVALAEHAADDLRVDPKISYSPQGPSPEPPKSLEDLKLLSNVQTSEVQVPKSSETTKPAEVPKPSETIKPAEVPKPSETTKPAEVSKPSETIKPAEISKPSETIKPAEVPKPSETIKPTEVPKPSETIKPAEVPKPSETIKPAEVPKPSETTKPAEVSKPSETIKPAEVPKPSETIKPTEVPKPSETTKPAEDPKPSETTTSSEVPKPSETTKPAEVLKPSETTKPAEVSKPSEIIKSAEVPKPSETVASASVSQSTVKTEANVHLTTSSGGGQVEHSGEITVSSDINDSQQIEMSRKYTSKMEEYSAVSSSQTLSSATFESSRTGFTSSQLHYQQETLVNGVSRRVALTSGEGGKPVFVKALEGCNVEPGHKAVFECSLESSMETSVKWLKDNKPLDDKLADRVRISENKQNGDYKLEVIHCAESDSGVYSALAENPKGMAHCTAQLIVQELTPEERKEKGAYFLVRLKDTELMENTYLRFMIKVKGDPNPRIKFFKDGVEIKEDDTRVQIVRDHADSGFYELIIVSVTTADAGKYSCTTSNMYGSETCEATVSVCDDKNIFGDLEQGAIIPPGEKASFSWRRNGQPFDPEERFKVLLGDDEDSLALVFQHVRPEDAGLYTCVAQTNAGNISCSAELTVQGSVNQLNREPEKPKLVIENKETLVSVGGSAMLELQCIGFPKPDILWKHEGKVLEPSGRYKFLYEDEESMSLVIKHVTTHDAGSYTIHAKNDLGEHQIEMTLIVKAAPKIKHKMQDQICMTDSDHTMTIEVEGSPAPEVTFFKDGVHLTDGSHFKITRVSEETYTLTIKGAALTDSGSYSVVAKNEINQCSDYWHVKVSSPPKILQKMEATRECGEGETVTFQIQVEADPPPTVKWFKDGVEVKPDAANVKMTSEGGLFKLTVSGVTRNDSGNYTCEVSNAHGVLKDQATLNVRCAPQFIKKLTDSKANEGEMNVEFVVSVNAYPKPTVKWYYGDAEITEKRTEFTRIDQGDSYKLMLKEVTTEMSGKYCCKVQNQLGSDESSASFTVFSKPKITRKLLDMTVDQGATLRMEVEIEGCPEPKLKWLKDGREVSTDARIKIERDSQRLENYSLTVNLVKEEDGGEYEVQAVNEMGSVSCKSTVVVHTQEVSASLDRQEITEEITSVAPKQISQGPAESPKFSKGEKAERKQIKYIEVEEGQALGDEDVVDVGEGDSSAQRGIKSVIGKEKIETVKMNQEDAKRVEENQTHSKQRGEAEGRGTIETITTFKRGEGESIIVTVVSSTRCQDAIITGPPESHTLPVVREGIELEMGKSFRTILKPNKQHETSLQVEEIFPCRLEQYRDLHKWRSSNNAVVEEPESESERANHSDGKNSGRVSIVSLSEEECSPSITISRDPSYGDNIFSFDRNPRGNSAARDSGVMRTSSWELRKGTNSRPSFLEELNRAPRRYYNRRDYSRPDATYSCNAYSEQYKDKVTPSMILGDAVLKCNLPARRNIFNIREEESRSDIEMEDLFRRIKIQRDALSDILSKEGARKRALPEITKIFMEDKQVYESLPLEYAVFARGLPKPEAKWTVNGEPVKQSQKVKVSEEGDCYKLEILDVRMVDAGEYQCEISNKLGATPCKAKLTVIPEYELRKPKFIKHLETQKIPQKQPVTLTAVCTADPPAQITWCHNGQDIVADATVKLNREVKEIENGLKECTCTLDYATGRYGDTGEYTVKATNKYGYAESSARLDILIRPEIEPLKDINAMPFQETQFVAIIHANPVAEVTWYKEGSVVKSSESIQVIEEPEHDQYRLVFKTVKIVDDGVYTVEAKNSQGEASAKAVFVVNCQKPTFSKQLEDVKVKDYDEAVFKIKCSGIPEPVVKWTKDGEPLEDGGRYKIRTKSEGHIESELIIQHFKAEDAGKYAVSAANAVGDVATLSNVKMAQIPPGFIHKLDKAKDLDEGEPLELKAKLDGSPIPTAKWYKNGEELKGDERIATSSSPDGSVQLMIPQCVPSDCGAYKLVATNPHGETSALCAVAINPTPRKPSFIKGLTPCKALVGEMLKLEAQIIAFPAPEIKWYKDGLPVRASQAVNFINQPGGLIGLAIDEASPDDAGKYSVTITNKLGEISGSAQVDVQLKEKIPSFFAELQPTSVVEGFPVKLEAKCGGYPKPTIKWTHNGVEMQPDGHHIKITSLPNGTQCLILDKATAQDGGEYAVHAINEKGDVASRGVLTVAGRGDDSLPEERPFFLHALRQVSVEEGSPLILESPFAGNPIPDVIWTKDGQPIEPSERVTITCDGRKVGIEIKPAAMSDAGVYGCRLVSPLGEDTSTAKVNVRKVYQMPIFAQKFTDLQQLPTFDAKFPARVLGVPRPEITWYFNDKPVTESDKYHIKRDGDACCLYIKECKPGDAGVVKCVAKNKEGESTLSAKLEIVDKIEKKQRMEPPSFLKKIGDTEVYKGMTAKFTACALGSPEPEVEWYRDDTKLFPTERIRIDRESTGLLRLSVMNVDPADVGRYSCKISNSQGEDICHAELRYDTLEGSKRPLSDQYNEFDKLKKTGVPMPLADRPIISKMTDRHLTLSWNPSIPHGPRVPVTYQVEMCELPDGDWFTARTGVRSCACEIRNLEPYRDYRFRIRVENKYGISDPSPYAITHRMKLEPSPPRFVPYLEPSIDFRPHIAPHFPKDFDIERPPHDGYAQAPKFLRQEHDTQYGVKNHNSNLFWYVYGYPKPKMSYYFNDELIESGGRYDWSYTRNGQATLFINKMLERDVGVYEAVASNEHGEARQRVKMDIAEYPVFIRRPEETVVMVRRSGRLEARVVGVPYPELKWYKDWQPLAPTSRIKMQFIPPDTSVLLINEAISKDEGLYSLTATNVAGSVSSSAMVHIEENEQEFCYRSYLKTPTIKPKVKPFGDLYDIGDELGRGTQGVTYHAVERMTGRNYAAKIMHGKDQLKQYMYNEMEIMNSLNHRKLIRLHDAFETKRNMTLVLELAGGGELVRDSILKQSHYTEGEIAGYIRQILWGLEYMHDINIAHLGLTIGDLLISHPGSDDLKICDFGLARRIPYGKQACLDYGMPEYVAPEVVNGEGVGFPADMWSVGIITYILLSGRSPFRGANDRETLTKIREGKWEFEERQWWSKISEEGRDFITKLLVYKQEDRMEVKTALRHPWLVGADKIPQDAHTITTDRLNQYYTLYRDWMSNASCRTWYRRRPLSGAFEHPSRMVYPPGMVYTPEPTPEREPKPPEPPHIYEHPDYEIGIIKSESHYQYGPDTYLLQLRDVDFPVRLREYMKVATNRSPTFSLALSETYDWRLPIIHERRRFTDVMDEEIDDERKQRINKYGETDSYTLRRIRHEIGSRLDSYAEAEAIIESKKDGQLPFFREKPQILPILEGQPTELTCFAVGDPKPIIQWFKNDMVIAEGNRIKIIEDESGRSVLKFCPALHHDVGIYKVVARNRVGQTVARTRVVQASVSDAPDSPTAGDISDTEILLRWKQPKHDGNSAVLCYNLQYKEAESVDWIDVASNIDHEFYLMSELKPATSYQFRLAARNKIGWSEKGIPTKLIKTAADTVPKIQITKAMKHLQQLTEAGQSIVLDEEKVNLDYSCEQNPMEWSQESNLTDKYSFISEVSRGKFSVVVKGIDKSNDSVVIAKLMECHPDAETQVNREYECLRRLRHERIGNLLAAYKAPSTSIAVLIMEKLQGADILTYLSSRHDYSEQVVATIVTQILDALQYLHWRGYCHLDLQPDNVVMASVRSVQIKLVDFGSACKVSRLGTSVPKVGHLEFMSPEMLNDEPVYPQSDVWSVGVLTYILLSGVSPFRGADDAETKQNISFVRYRFEHLYKELSQEATRFLMALFKRAPNKRPLAEECHDHRWLMASDFMIKKRERALFLGNRLKEFSEEYHKRRCEEATKADNLQGSLGGMAPRMLARSNSIQEELITSF